jgi:hypothetical protein
VTPLRGLPVVLAIALTASCGSDTTPSGPTANANTLPGTWVGTVTYSLGNVGRGNVTLNIQNAQTNGTYMGTWSFEFANAANNRQGSFTTSVPRELVFPGAGSALDIEFTLQPQSTPSCTDLPGFPPSYSLRLALRSGRMSGESLIGECGQLFPGAVELTRR